MNKKLRPCPVCEGSNREVLHQQRFCEGALGGGYDVVVCKDCGMGFADGIPDQDELDHYYAEQSKYTYDASGGKESEYDLRRFERIVDQVEPYISKDARILDVGCATGGLLSVLKSRGYRNIVGADPSEACAAAARRLYGVTVRTSTVFDLDSWTDEFDLVIMVGVLEHICDVHRAITKLKARIAARSGMIYIAVPDTDGFAECQNAPFQQFSTEHVNFFDSSSVSRAFLAHGMGAARIQRYNVEWRAGIYEPVLSAIFRQTTDLVGAFPSRQEPGCALRRYIEWSRVGDSKLVARLETFRRTRQPVMVWGAGTLARRLYAAGHFDGLHLCGFVDGNPAGRSIGPFRVLDPAALVKFDGIVLVCSQTFREEIFTRIREEMGLPNELVCI
jgi:SAM-dependent methyltransferase